MDLVVLWLWPGGVEITFGDGTTDWISAAAAVVVAVAALGALQQLSEIRNDRHVDVFADLAARWASAETVEALKLEHDYTRETLAELFGTKKTDPESGKARTVLMRIPNYFEDALFIARVGRLDRREFDEYMSGIALVAWARWEPAIKELQKDDPLAYIEFQRFAEKVIEAEKRAGRTGR